MASVATEEGLGTLFQPAGFGLSSHEGSPSSLATFKVANMELKARSSDAAVEHLQESVLRERQSSWLLQRQLETATAELDSSRAQNKRLLHELDARGVEEQCHRDLLHQLRQGEEEFLHREEELWKQLSVEKRKVEELQKVIGEEKSRSSRILACQGSELQGLHADASEYHQREEALRRRLASEVERNTRLEVEIERLVQKLKEALDRAENNELDFAQQSALQLSQVLVEQLGEPAETARLEEAHQREAELTRQLQEVCSERDNLANSLRMETARGFRTQNRLRTMAEELQKKKEAAKERANACVQTSDGRELELMCWKVGPRADVEFQSPRPDDSFGEESRNSTEAPTECPDDQERRLRQAEAESALLAKDLRQERLTTRRLRLKLLGLQDGEEVDSWGARLHRLAHSGAGATQDEVEAETGKASLQIAEARKKLTEARQWLRDTDAKNCRLVLSIRTLDKEPRGKAVVHEADSDSQQDDELPRRRSAYYSTRKPDVEPLCEDMLYKQLSRISALLEPSLQRPNQGQRPW
eukprot:CAMPEP_0197629868 /NCGR_PEP_ID=MMETSP1338-20131121/7552_1 /TAXON_ID=43686 ORGANISM="Pelagodinium beii, Strain RCC1491" /NCGR_SAMPLE_ID=MMETSP1338 /ASSEMBLY_ACC=CAM_ASM_000754 /LENGTH=530 /DNA_ID=CAMNT_0043200977 /DNA_START=74 /DNA_END=1663 /DNA_ORIENTATION=+